MADWEGLARLWGAPTSPFYVCQHDRANVILLVRMYPFSQNSPHSPCPQSDHLENSSLMCAVTRLKKQVSQINEQFPKINKQVPQISRQGSVIKEQVRIFEEPTIFYENEIVYAIEIIT